ncbi:hypothetical protein SAMN04488691_11431 [Haloferax larsenii]|uniref:Uncharacterized protein n=2 Tax=Haloferax larsenii TaxID=302484 RepID=A0A1H7UTG5_HALLR|nr:hypothetical protein SAMN04488691_11431 [Haloferax larsenii]
MAASSGCVRLEGYSGGRLTVFELDSIPQNADAVKQSHRIVQSSPVIQQGIQNLDDEAIVEIELTRAEFRSVSSNLNELPYYDRSKDMGSLPSGYYVSLDKSVACLVLQAYCSDVPGVAMEREGFDNCLTE